MTRHEFISSKLHKDDRILEIGPLNLPAVRKEDYPQVFYCDIRSTEEVKALYSGNDYLQVTGLHVDTSTIVNIDFVLRDSYQATFKDVEKFDAFVACHVIEHIPDIIGFLQDIATVLKPHAKVVIAYPDRRYCFDHFRTDASFRDAYDVFVSGQKQLARFAMDFLYSAIDENDPAQFWNNTFIDKLLPTQSFDAAKKQYDECMHGLIADDAHYWIFSDFAFVRFLYDCTRAGMLPFVCTDFIATQPNTQEFYITLSYEPETVNNVATELANLKSIYFSLTDKNLESELMRKAAELVNTKAEITVKEAEIEAINKELTSLLASHSWRLTAPLRAIVNRLRK